MRKVLLALFLLISILTKGQSPEKINYQGMLRDASNAALPNTSFTISFEILQGSATGSVVFTEQQSLTTNTLGLFSTHIGNINSLSAVNWPSGQHFLQVSVQLSGGSFIPMGSAQELVSVPYALNASSVPATFSNNVLTIGNNNSFTINMPAVADPTIQSAGIAVVNPSTGLNYTVDVPAPVLSITNNTLSLTQGTAVTTANLPVFSSSLTSTGIITSTTSGNDFTVHANPPSVVVTSTPGAAGVSSLAPGDFTINIPTASLVSSGAATTATLSANSYSVHVPVTDITVSSSVGVAGVSSAGTNSFNINIPVASTTTLSSSGAAATTTLATNAFSIHVPQSNISVSSTVGVAGVSTSGTNSFAINIPPPIQYTNGSGISMTSGTVINNTAPDQIVTITGTNGVTVNSAYPNFTISPPPVSLSGAGIVTVSAGPAFVIGAPSPSFTSVGPSSITGTYPNLTLTSPASPTISAAGIATVSAGPNYNVGVQSPTYTSVGPSSITGTYPNLTLTSPASPTVSAAGIATVSAGPNYNVGVQSPSYTSVGPSSITGTYPNLTLTSPATPTVSAAGIATVSAGPNYVVGVPQPTFAYSNTTGSLTSGTSSAYITPSLTYSAGVLSAGPNSNSVAINTGTNALWSTIGNVGTNAGVNFIGTTDNNALNFRVNNLRAGTINHLVLNTALGYRSLEAVTTGTANTAIGADALRSVTSGNQNVALGNSTMQNLTTGSNNVALGYSALAANNSINNIAIGSSALAANTTGNSNVAIGLSAMGLNLGGNYNVAVGHVAGGQTSGGQNVFIGYSSGAQNNGSGNVFIGYQSGFNVTGNNKLFIANSTTSVNPLIFGDFSTGNVSIGTATANQKLNVDGNISLDDQTSLAAPTRIIGFPTAIAGNHSNLTIQAKSNAPSGIAYTGGNLNLAAGDFNFSGAGGTYGGVVTIRAGRNVFDGSGGGDIVFQAGGAAYLERMRIVGVNGNVGIGTAAPMARFHVDVPNALFQINDFAPGSGSIVNTVLMATIIGKANNGPQMRFNTQPSANFIDIGQNATGDFVVEGNDNIRFLVQNTGNVGIGNSAPNAPLQFANTIVNRKIVLWEGANDDHQYYGLGINGGTLRYQVDATSAAHVFFAATSAASSNEIFRINGTGHVRMGNETGTGQGPTYPAGGGMIIRRLFTSNTTAGEVVARTDQMTFERDGTNGGFRINNTAGNTNEVCNCMGVTSAGVAFNRALNNLPLGVTQVYLDANSIVFLHCFFGDPFNAGHMTEVSLTRQFPDYYWVGTVTTTQNQ